LEERLISLKKDIAASLVQWKTTLSEVDRSRLGDLMDMRSDQMKQVETELNELGEPDFDCQYRRFKEDLPKIDFTKAMKIVDGILQQFGRDGGTALFLMEKSHAMAGTYCVDQIRGILGTDAKKCRIQFTPDKGLDERALLDCLAGYFKVTAISDNQQYAQAIVEAICTSSRTQRAVFIDLWQWDELLCQEQVLSWFLEHFWLPLRQRLQVVAQDYRGVRVVAVIVVENELSPECSKLPCYCTTYKKFDGQKIAKLPLKKWTVEEIQHWLEDYSGMPIDKCETRARKIYAKSMKGIPQLVVTALENETFT
jgi:hypothetical protein